MKVDVNQQANGKRFKKHKNGHEMMSGKLNTVGSRKATGMGFH